MTGFSIPISASTRRLALLVLILLLGWALRTHAVESRSLWEDEGWTMLLTRGPGLDDVARTLAADQHPPLFFLLFRLWRGVAGDGELAARYLGVLAGMVAVAGIYQLGRALFNPAVGVLAALLLALADLHIDLSQEVRHYSLLVTWMVLSSLFYVRWWRCPSRASRIGYVLTSLALLYTHYLGAFVLAVQFIHLLLTVRLHRKLWEGLFLFGAVGMGFLPWLPVVIDQNRLRWQNPLYYQNALPNTMDTYRAVRTALLGSHFGLMIGLLVAGLVYLEHASARPSTRVRFRFRPRWPLFYLALWIGLVVVVTVIVNERRQFLTVRNFILVVPPILILVAHGLTNLERTARLLLVSVILLVGLTTIDARRYYPDWRAVTRNVTRYHLDGEPVLMEIWVGDFPVRYYIDHQMGRATPRVSLREWRDQYRGQFIPALQDYFSRLDAFWLIYWGDGPMTEYGPLIEEAGFQRTAALSVDHLGTPLYSYRYDRVPAGTIASFANLLALRKFSAADTVVSGDTLTVALWWMAEQPVTLDYSVSVFLLDQAGVLTAQHDGPPLDGIAPTHTWQPGQLKYDLHRLALPASLSPGTYQLGLKVYWYGDLKPLPAESAGMTAGEYVNLGVVQVLPR